MFLIYLFEGMLYVHGVCVWYMHMGRRVCEEMGQDTCAHGYQLYSSITYDLFLWQRVSHGTWRSHLILGGLASELLSKVNIL